MTTKSPTLADFETTIVTSRSSWSTSGRRRAAVVGLSRGHGFTADRAGPLRDHSRADPGGQACTAIEQLPLRPRARQRQKVASLFVVVIAASLVV